MPRLLTFSKWTCGKSMATKFSMEDKDDKSPGRDLTPVDLERIAEGVRMKVPYLAVIGKREAESDTVAVNVRGAGKEQKPAPVAVGQFIDRVLAEAKTRSLTLAASGIGNRESGIQAAG